jgi:hypothetical protein
VEGYDEATEEAAWTLHQTLQNGSRVVAANQSMQLAGAPVVRNIRWCACGQVAAVDPRSVGQMQEDRMTQGAHRRTIPTLYERRPHLGRCRRADLRAYAEWTGGAPLASA